MPHIVGRVRRRRVAISDPLPSSRIRGGAVKQVLPIGEESRTTGGRLRVFWSPCRLDAEKEVVLVTATFRVARVALNVRRTEVLVSALVSLFLDVTVSVAKLSFTKVRRHVLVDGLNTIPELTVEVLCDDPRSTWARRSARSRRSTWRSRASPGSRDRRPGGRPLRSKDDPNDWRRYTRSCDFHAAEIQPREFSPASGGGGGCKRGTICLACFLLTAELRGCGGRVSRPPGRVPSGLLHGPGR